MDSKKKKAIPQILQIKKISTDGKFRLKKIVLKHLKGYSAEKLMLHYNNEILLSIDQGSGKELPLQKRNRLQFPSEFLRKMGIKKDNLICFIERPKAVAIKNFSVKFSESTRPKIVDLETHKTVTRYVESFPEPKKLLKQLIESSQEITLDTNPLNYWKYKETFAAWKARTILGITDENDILLQKKIIQERFNDQKANGSWDDNIVLTAKNLLDLYDLGMSRNYPQIQEAISWLMDRPESPHNPGMFFLSDELIEEQQEIIAQRKEITKGPRPRFRKRLKSELRELTLMSPFYNNPCGPRIMWPNALVLEALLAFGYENHARVPTILETLAYGDWCECNYQHGIYDWKRKQPMSMQEVITFEKQTINEFLLGGIKNRGILYSDKLREALKRISEKKTGEITEYRIKLPTHIQGCELITAQALGRVQDEKLHLLAEAHLYRFAIAMFNALRDPQGMLELKRYSLHPYTFLRAITQFSSSPAKIGIYLLLPWIKEENCVIALRKV
jgi:hypothetical protein